VVSLGEEHKITLLNLPSQWGKATCSKASQTTDIDTMFMQVIIEPLCYFRFQPGHS
jgi:hypothetical protein